MRARALVESWEPVSGLRLELDDDALDALANAVAARLDNHERWVGVKDAAAHINAKPQRVYDLVHQRAIPHRKDGSRLLFRRSDLDRWLDDQ